MLTHFVRTRDPEYPPTESLAFSVVGSLADENRAKSPLLSTEIVSAVDILQELEGIRSGLRFFGDHPVPPQRVLERLDPVIEAIRLGQSTAPAGEWEPLPEVMERQSLSRSYFSVPLVWLGGKSRLQDWQERGLATQKTRGAVWLLHTSLKHSRGRKWARSEVAGSDNAESHAQESDAPKSELERTYQQMKNFKKTS